MSKSYVLPPFLCYVTVCLCTHHVPLPPPFLCPLPFFPIIHYGLSFWFTENLIFWFGTAVKMAFRPLFYAITTSIFLIVINKMKEEASAYELEFIVVLVSFHFPRHRRGSSSLPGQLLVSVLWTSPPLTTLYSPVWNAFVNRLLFWS